MNILFIVPSYKPAYSYGGPIVVIALLAEKLVQLGHTVTVYTTTANGRAELDVPVGKTVMVDGVKVTYFRRITGDHTHASPDLWKHLNKTVRDYDVVHLHSWWNLLIIVATWICQRKNVVPVLSPHGMFSRYIFTTNNSSKKKLLHHLIGKSLLSKTRLHVSTTLEWEESRQVIPNWQGAIIPNPVTLSSQVYTRPTNSVFTIGFLSRLDPKKGLDVLLQALSKVNFSYRLLIAGDGDPTYVQTLKELAITLGNADNLEWIGWKNGEDKFSFLAKLDLFALTSHSENFAIVVIEALSTGTPVIVSDQVGLHSYVSKHNYGWVTEMASDTITCQLNKIAMDKAKAAAIAAVTPSAIHAEYGGTHLAQQYVDLYQSIAHLEI
jgi:glycosyltransferase involved in cell wall biosynthesis